MIYENYSYIVFISMYKCYNKDIIIFQRIIIKTIYNKKNIYIYRKLYSNIKLVITL